MKFHLRILILVSAFVLTLSAEAQLTSKEKIEIIELNSEIFPFCYAVKFKSLKTSTIGWFVIEKKAENKELSEKVKVGGVFKVELQPIHENHNCDVDDGIEIRRGSNTFYFIDGYKVYESIEFENLVYPKK